MPRKKETFLLVSLNEDKAKELAQVVTNNTCRKILDYLADNEATESELAEKLGLPISTVHYNLQQLQKGGLVESEEYHYSEKGKEVNHYRLANKYIIIAPKTTYGLKEKLRSILPVALIAAGVALFMQFFSRLTGVSNFAAPTALKAMQAAAPMAEDAAADLAMDMAQETAVTGGRLAAEKTAEAVPAAAPTAAQAVPTAAPILAEPSIWQNIALWFFIGAVFALLLYLLINWWRNREK